MSLRVHESERGNPITKMSFPRGGNPEIFLILDILVLT